MLPFNFDFAEERMPYPPIPGERLSRARRSAVTGTARGTGSVFAALIGLVGGLIGCQDARSPTAPVRHAQPTADVFAVTDPQLGTAASEKETGPAAATIAIEDAIERVLPALEEGAPTDALEAGLRQLQAQLESGKGRGLRRALAELQEAIDALQTRADKEYQADIGVVQLALETVARG